MSQDFTPLRAEKKLTLFEEVWERHIRFDSKASEAQEGDSDDQGACPKFEYHAVFSVRPNSGCEKL